jgi:hypothetical protein
LNGADLRDWRGDSEDGEFQRLVERVEQLLAEKTEPGRRRQISVESPPVFPARPKSSRRIVLLALGAIGIVAAGIAGYLWRGDQPEPRRPEPPISLPRTAEPELGSSDMERRIRDLVGSLGTAMPATSLAKGFHVPDLGLRIAYLTPEQSASTFGAMPAGAVVMEVESGRPMPKRGFMWETWCSRSAAERSPAKTISAKRSLKSVPARLTIRIDAAAIPTGLPLIARLAKRSDRCSPD